MTLVRIDVIEGRRSAVQLEILADTVHPTGSWPIVCRTGCSLREDELIVTIVENTHADWSFTDDGRDGNL